MPTDTFSLSIAALALAMAFLTASGLLGVGILAAYRFKHRNKGGVPRDKDSRQPA